MTQYREILRLHSQGISQRSIASSVGCSRNTVASAIHRAQEDGLSWPLPAEMTDAKLQKLLHVKPAAGAYKQPDYEQIHRGMAKSGVTLSLLWSEYCERCRQSGDVPFMYTQFCKYYRDYAAVDKLIEMRLSVMANAFRSQQKDVAFTDLSFEERFGLLVDSEWASRKNNKLQRLIRAADFNFPGARVEDIEYHQDRKLDKPLITKLSTCQYILELHNVIILGASGAGKTYLACALGIAACRNFFKVCYVRLPDLLNELAVARGTGSYQKVMKQYKKVNLLILDEWLLLPLTPSEARDLLEIIEARHQRASTIFLSQFAPAGWHTKIGEDTLADVILDRIVHDSYEIFIDGDDSMRKRKGLLKSEAPPHQP